METLQMEGTETGPMEEDTNPTSNEESANTASQVPQKFKNKDGSVNVDSLLKSYSELERSRSAASEESSPNTEAAPVDSQAISHDDALRISDELAANGVVSEETYEQLKQKGLSKDMADQYLDGQRAIAEKIKEELWEPVGGEEAYSKMQEWAAENFPPAEIQTYDRIMVEGDMETKKIIVQGLAARFAAANPQPPQLMSGNVGPSSASNAFESWAQVTEAMRDPRYDRDEAYRSKIDQRLAISNNI